MKTDEQLWTAYVAGDSSALTDLLERHRGPLTRYVAVKGVKDPADTVQAVFIRLVETGLPPGMDFKYWLYQAADELAQEQRTSDRSAAKWLDTPEAEMLAETYQR